MDDLISRQAAIKWCRPEEWGTPDERWRPESEFGAMLEALPSAQPERIIYSNLSDEQFERWLYEHGICSPNIHESIPCDAVPLLIDNAISELPSVQQEIIRCKDCKYNDLDEQNSTTRWLPCIDTAWPDDWFCGCAERRKDG